MVVFRLFQQRFIMLQIPCLDASNAEAEHIFKLPHAKWLIEHQQTFERDIEKQTKSVKIEMINTLVCIYPNLVVWKLPTANRKEYPRDVGTFQDEYLRLRPEFLPLGKAFWFDDEQVVQLCKMQANIEKKKVVRPTFGNRAQPELCLIS